MSANPLGLNTPNDDFNRIVKTGKTLDKTIVQELGCPDLSVLLAATGTSDLYKAPFESLRNEQIEVSEKEIPPQVRSKIPTTRYFISVGILKEIGRAWMSIDNCLYLWDYATGGDICEYTDQDQVICSVGFVKPRAGVFDTNIEYLLIISTPLQIIALGLNLEQPKQLGDQSILTIIIAKRALPSDDTTMKSIVGTADGRVFMVGHPTSNQSNTIGDIYEYDYSSTLHWSVLSSSLISRTESVINRFLPSPFKVKTDSNVKDIFVDNERQLLYVLTFNSDIEIIYIGNNGYDSIFKHTNVIDHVQQMCRQQQKIFSRDEFTVVSLHVIPKEESQKIILMAMTTGGFRLFFTGHPSYVRLFSPTGLPNDKPTTLELAHVRLPPPVPSLNPEAFKPRFNTTFYSRGTCVSTTFDGYSDGLCMTAITSVKPENQTGTLPKPDFVNTDQFIEATAFKISDCKFTAIEVLENGTKSKELSQQLSDPQKRFLIASVTSIYVYSKMRPVDMLEHLIRRYHPSDDNCRKEILSFFRDFGISETCTMCLSIACDSGDEQVIDIATQLFFEYGGVPSATNGDQLPNNFLGQANTTSGVIYSGKHDGFVLYLTRLLGPVWSSNLFIPGENGKTYVCCEDTGAALESAKIKLNKLKKFMDTHKAFHEPADVSDPRFQVADFRMLSLYLEEQKSMHELYLFFLHCVDSVEFAMFAMDSYSPNIINRYLSVDKPSLMKDLNVKMMLTSLEVREFCHELVVTKIDETAVRSPVVESITCRLQRCCSIFFTQGEHFFFKGMELIRRALNNQIEDDKIHILKQSLLQIQQASEGISVNHLERVCALYQQQSFHIGVVELMLDRARKLDPRQKALFVYENDGEADDVSKQLFDDRLKCYDLIIKALKDARSLMLPNANLENRAPIIDKALYVKQVFEEAVKSKDPMFHYQLYYWYIGEDRIGELLHLDTEYLVPFFTNILKDEYKSLEFLWQHYRAKSQYYEAACCLAQLTQLPNEEITIDIRLRHLAIALVNCRCAEGQPNVSSLKNSQLLQKLNTIAEKYRAHYLTQKA